MLVYILMTIFSLLLAPLCNKTLIIGRKRSGKNVYLLLFMLTCIFVMGLRSQNVGYDTAMYVRTFLRIGSYPDLNTALRSESNSNPVYILLCRIVYRISSDSQFHIFVEALIINIGFFIFIKRLSNDYAMSTFLYFGLSLMYFAMNGARQSIAMVLCANAIVTLAKNIKDIKGWILFAIATGIHITSFISAGLLAGIIVYNKRLDKKVVTAFFAATGTVTGSILLFLSSRLSSYFAHYEIYFNGLATYGIRDTDGGGRIIIIYFYLALFIVLWAFNGNKETHKIIEDSDSNIDNIFCRLAPGMAFGITTGIFNARNILISRMVLYYVLFFIPFLPYVINRFPKNLRLILKTGTVLAFSAYSYLFLRENQGAVVPYQFFWQ